MGGENDSKKPIKLDKLMFGVDMKAPKPYSVKVTIVACINCSRPFKNADQVTMHQPFCKGAMEAYTEKLKAVKNDLSKILDEEQTVETYVVRYKYTCQFCEFIFYNEKHYFGHMSKFRYECNTCQTHFENKQLLKTHYCLKFLKDLRSRMASRLPERALTQEELMPEGSEEPNGNSDPNPTHIEGNQLKEEDE
ncbi:PREDICTED: uncharacterized protein LOC108560016 [Nicrophorus vespilloides]|uniref:Uncharacterized protein LOC108560016 n=1 Tax=Nicrophorus vespilloides TaxID=110193 RepID=A0ABM1MEB8_NICVS|nr:PREDICTED: uncharacterized protein LOC108560016 [Nicrophorus vespilloides]